MKLLFLMNHIIIGGVEKVLLQYLSELHTLGIECVVLSRDRVCDKYFLDFFKSYNIKLVELNKHRPHFILNKIINRYVQKIKLHKYIINCDYIIDFANFSFAQQLRNISKHKIGYCHGSILFFNSCVNKCVLDIYDDIVCLSDAFKRDFIKQYPQYKNKIHRIYNPINRVEVIKLANKPKTLKPPYFVAVQRLDTDKDVATIIKAFKIFSEKHPRYMLYIIGDGPQRAKLEELASKNTIFTGKLDNPYPFIKNADALILSSTSTIGEGLGNTLLEAQILETLAISSDVKSGPREILLNGRAGILFPVGDYKKLATIMAKIADKNYDFAEIIKVATDNLNRFSTENTINKILNLINVEK